MAILCYGDDYQYGDTERCCIGVQRIYWSTMLYIGVYRENILYILWYLADVAYCHPIVILIVLDDIILYWYCIMHWPMTYWTTTIRYP